ncbi:MAG TPA: tRNA (N(6)-L-threonylcarbamoyladenosine(37)-C(2))-methylthiotransferase MtaB [Acidobacteriaceae bacterium]|nr:tRNA (N(6)-L-threonylcarbamoyladenosine(37)-C(2))-methylthiotransferase MtaB [Acidobacteriaceae bacterium]
MNRASLPVADFSPVDTLSNVAGYHVENFGCRASRADGEAIAANLRHSGLAPAAPDSAHVVIVNTCSVTAEADRQARAWLRRVRRQNPEARIVVTGCYAQRAPEELAALPEVNAVVGNSHKSLVAEVALQGAPGSGLASSAGFVPVRSLAPAVYHDDAFAHSELAALPFAYDAQQTRPNLKVQDGCGNRCSFCIIPTTRGHSRSIPLVTCLDNVRRFVDQSGRELVLSGINLGRWGRDLTPSQRFEDMVAAILSETTLPRLRLSSIEPMDWSPDLLALYRQYATDSHGPNADRCTPNASSHPVPCTLHPVAHPRLARHTHLPLQSGSDTILRRMYRRYRPWHYAERLASIRALLPDAAIGADVMIGFPGETDALFQEGYDFIAAQPLTYLHLFPFSARPGTPAWDLHRQQPVTPRAVQERMAALRALIMEKSRTFRTQFLGRILSAVTMDTGADGDTDAMSDNFIRLTLTATDGTPIPANQLVSVHITALTPDGLAGTLTSPASIQ